MPRYDQQGSPANYQEGKNQVSGCPGPLEPGAVVGSKRYCVLLFHLLGVVHQHLRLLHQRCMREPHLRTVPLLQRLL